MYKYVFKNTDVSRYGIDARIPSSKVLIQACNRKRVKKAKELRKLAFLQRCQQWEAERKTV